MGSKVAPDRSSVGSCPKLAASPIRPERRDTYGFASEGRALRAAMSAPRRSRTMLRTQEILAIQSEKTPNPRVRAHRRVRSFGGLGGTRTPDALLRTEEDKVEKPLI